MRRREPAGDNGGRAPRRLLPLRHEVVRKEGVVVAFVTIEKVLCQLTDVVADPGVAVVLRGVELQGVDPDIHGLTSDCFTLDRKGVMLKSYCSARVSDLLSWPARLVSKPAASEQRHICLLSRHAPVEAMMRPETRPGRVRHMLHGGEPPAADKIGRRLSDSTISLLRDSSELSRRI